MARRIIVIMLVTLVTLAAVAQAEAGSKNNKKGHASFGMITVTKHYDKASPVL